MQAKAEAEALQEVLSEAIDMQIATKTDIARLERQIDALASKVEARFERTDARVEARFERMDGKLTLVQWMLALIVAAEVMPLLAKLFQ